MKDFPMENNIGQSMRFWYSVNVHTSLYEERRSSVMSASLEIEGLRV